MTDYIAMIHKEEQSDYGVSFPDFPGCVTVGSTLDEAKDLAKEALQFHVDGMIADKEVIPDSSSLEDIIKKRDEQYSDAVAFMVSVTTPNDKHIRINITIPERLLQEADMHVKVSGKTRSGFFAESVGKALDNLHE